MEIGEVVAQLELVLEENKNQSCRIIVTQVDPDAIGSAIALSELLRRKYNRDVVVLYCGAIGHPQNRYLVTRYNLRSWMRPISEDKNANEDVTILVDSCSGNDRRLPPNFTFKPKIVIDHHRGEAGEREHDGLYWVEDAGATATLIIELCQVLCPEILSDPLYALLLAIAIHTDTGGMKSTDHRDRAAFDIVCRAFEQQELREIIDYTIPRTEFERFARAIQGWRVEDGKVVTGVGIIDPSEGDIVSTVAAKLILMEGITLVVVWAIIDDAIRISARSRDCTFDLGDIMRQKFGNGGAKVCAVDGHGEGGALVAMDLPKIFSFGDAQGALEKAVDFGVKAAVFGG